MISFISMNEKECALIEKNKKNVEMRLIYKLFKIEIVRVCLQQQTKM